MPTSLLPRSAHPSRGSLGRSTQLHCRSLLPEVPGEVACGGVMSDVIFASYVVIPKFFFLDKYYKER